MSPQAERLYQEAMRLPRADRVDLGALLVNGDEAEFAPEVEAIWAEEIKRRVDAIDSGQAQLIPWEEVKAEMLRKIEDARTAAAAPRRSAK